MSGTNPTIVSSYIHSSPIYSASSSSSSTSPSTVSSKTTSTPVHSVQIHRRSSIPSIGETPRNPDSSVQSSSQEQRIASVTIPTLSQLTTSTFSSTFSSPPSSLTYKVFPPLPNTELYTEPNHFSYTQSSTSSTTMSIADHTNLLQPPSPMKRQRSSSLPPATSPNKPSVMHPMLVLDPNNTLQTVTLIPNSSSLSTLHSDVHKRYSYHLDPKENKDEGQKKPFKSRDIAELSNQDIQRAEKLIATKKPDDLQKGIDLYRRVLKREISSRKPSVEPFFRLVDILENTGTRHFNEIINILDAVKTGHFEPWVKVDAISRANMIYIKIILASWEQAKIVMQGLTSASDKRRVEIYREDFRVGAKKLNKILHPEISHPK